MIKRLQKYILYKFVQYIPGTSKLAVMEAKRLSEYIFDNFTASQQLIILDELKLNLITMQEDQIKNKELELFQKEDNLKSLKSSLVKLNTK
jgi:hypothetical protein